MKTATIPLQYQPYCEMPPQQQGTLWQQACSNDEATIRVWREIWLKQIAENHKRFGPFKDRGVGKLWGRHQFLPAVVCGSGPGLAENGLLLKGLDPRIPIVSCLHNFHWHVDNDVRCDYFLTLDAGKVTIEEVSEGGKLSEEEYWKATERFKLIAFIGSPPELIEKWRGEIFWMNCPIPDQQIVQELDQLERFHTYVSTGGNVLGAATYFAKAILGCNPIAFLGANFSFSYQDKFHGWDSKYDADLGNFIRMTDVYGIKVKTWRSYANFAAYFNWLVTTVTGVWINCTEGGIFGATADGNIRQLIQMPLEDFIKMVQLSQHTREACEDPNIEERRILY